MKDNEQARDFFRQHPEAAARLGARDGFCGESTGTGTADWPDPEPLGSDLPPVEPFSSDLLPQSFRPLVDDVSARMQTPVDFAAAATVEALAGCVNRRAVIQPKEKDTHAYPVVSANPNRLGSALAWRFGKVRLLRISL
jgi:hypothetical protein